MRPPGRTDIGVRLPPWFRAVFTGCRYSNIFLAAVFLFTLGREKWNNSVSAVDLLWAMGLTIAFVLKHINYYAYQLMHDTKNDWIYLIKHHRVRRAPLADDLARGS